MGDDNAFDGGFFFFMDVAAGVECGSVESGRGEEEEEEGVVSSLGFFTLCVEGVEFFPGDSHENPRSSNNLARHAGMYPPCHARRW
jgi:hypothetical protein